MQDEKETKIKPAGEVHRENEKELNLIRLYDILMEFVDAEISELEMEDGQKIVSIILKDVVYDKEIGFKFSKNANKEE